MQFKNSNIKLVYILFIVFLFSCNENRKNDKSKIKESNFSISDSLNSVLIKGFTDDPKSFEYFNIIDYSSFFGQDSKTTEKTNSSKKTLQIRISEMGEPQLFEIFAFGDSTNYNTRIFVTPGDSLKMNIVNKRISFEGENAAHYNFYNQLDPLNTEWGSNTFKGDLETYKKLADNIYKRRLFFFKQYIKNHKVSQNFEKKIEAELKFEYLFNLIAPRSIATDFSSNLNNPNFTEALSSNYIKNYESIINTDEYFDNIHIEDFKRPELLKNDYFKRSLTLFIRYYFAKTESIPYSFDNFKSEQKYIEDNLNGKLKDFALTRLLYDYHKKGLGTGIEEAHYLKKIILDSKKLEMNQYYVEMLEEIEEELDLSGFKFSENILKEKLISLEGDTITLNEILANSDGKIKILDFWATWCSPCIKEMEKSTTLKNDEDLKGKVEWIYISIDYSDRKWINKINNWNIDLGNNSKHYKIIDISGSKLLEILKTDRLGSFFIPRYVILGPLNEVQLFSAPKPSDTLNFKRILNKIILKQT